jgi:hypothetical protein
MNKSQIFFSFSETMKIEQLISIVPGNDYGNKIRQYITFRANQFINHHNKYLEVKKNDIYQVPYLSDRYLFAVIQTKTNTNHPYLMFLNLDEIYITFIIPFGKDYKQADLELYEESIEECNTVELAALNILLENTIIIRKEGILNSKQFSLIHCSNISNCRKKYIEIDKLAMSPAQKLELKAQYREYYEHKAMDFLEYYFKLLELKDYEEAREFLKGNDSKYYGKQRLNTFFKNTKSIIGHLEIFITLYEIFHSSKKKLFGI